MFKAKDGKKFGSIFAGKRYDAEHTEDGLHSESPEHEEQETPEFEAGEREGMGENEPNDHEEDMHPAVNEHGAAHKVTIHHDHKAGRHTVVSHHKDGHTHTSVHDAAHKAHDEARKLAAVPEAGKEKNEEKDSPFHQGKNQASASSEEDDFMAPDIYAQE